MIKRIFCVVIGIIIILSMFSTVSAKEIVENTNILFRDIKISVDDNILQPDTEPFIYQGRTYIPARALAEAMGGEVTWDEKSNTVTVVNQKAIALKALALGIYDISMWKSFGREITQNLLNLLSVFDYIVYNIGNPEDIKEQCKEAFEETNYIFNLCKESEYIETIKACELVGMDYNNINNAIFYYEQALLSMHTIYNYLETYSTSSVFDVDYFSECFNRACEYRDAGNNIFNEYFDAFVDYTLYN